MLMYYLVGTFSKSSIPIMRADSQFAVVEAVIKGYNKWVSAHGKAPHNDVRPGSIEPRDCTESLILSLGVKPN